jgi:hypothetical protein
MIKVEFFADRNPQTNGYGMIAVVNGAIQPVGPQNFTSEQHAISALVRAVGDAIKPSPA